jgi:L-threonylcarbamoyladenylate synthase
MTETLAPDDAGLARAARLLAEGALVAFPTETVYGLGADARNGRAVAAVFAAKGRPRFNPLIVHVADTAAAQRLAVFDATAERLVDAFWPGPLTLVLPRRPDCPLSDLVAAGLPTLALRVPAHPVAQGLLAAFGGAVAAPSANPSGRISPTAAAHVLEGLDGRIAAVVDGGPCPVGVESTILGLADGVPRLLRPGGLPAEALEACLGRPLADPVAAEGVQAPGMLASHYAPAARLRLAPEGPRPDEVWIGFGPGDAAALNLSPGGDLVEAAAALFATLRAADTQAGPEGRIAVRPVPERGLGRAINDRLRRAAAPREGAA